MRTLQVYESELSKFNWLDDTKTVMVAGADIEGIVQSDSGGSVDPRELVGTGAPDAGHVRKGTKWQFREDRPLVTTLNADGSIRGRFAFLVSA